MLQDPQAFRKESDSVRGGGMLDTMFDEDKIN
jgi:hypothetical protein